MATVINDTSKKVILITGSTSGIGLKTAEILLSQGHQVIVASRSLSKVKETVSKLSTQFPNAKVSGHALDLGSLSSVEEFCRSIKTEYTKLDVLLLNAGMTSLASKIELSVDGLELVFATNHLGHFLLVERLLSLSPSRVVILSSGTHDPKSGSGTPAPNPDVKDWPLPKKFDASVAYSTSKLANAMYGNYLSRVNQQVVETQNTVFTVAIYDPGFIGNTGLLRGMGYFQPVIKAIVESLIATIAWWRGIPNQNSTLERSCPYLARLAVDPLFTVQTGKYYSIDHENVCSSDASNLQKQDELVEMSRTILIEKGHTLS